MKGNLEISSDQVKETKKGKGTFKGMLEKITYIRHQEAAGHNSGPTTQQTHII